MSVKATGERRQATGVAQALLPARGAKRRPFPPLVTERPAAFGGAQAGVPAPHWPAHRLSPVASRLVPARPVAFGTENNRRNSHDLIAFRIEETLKFIAKRSF
jgi:hypothetical protein